MVDSPRRAAFADRIDALLTTIEAAADRLSDDVDIDSARSGNVLTLTFENGQRIVINSQHATEELWLAARSGGYHYRLDDATGRWLDTRGGDPFDVALGRVVEAEAGVPLVL